MKSRFNTELEWAAGGNKIVLCVAAEQNNLKRERGEDLQQRTISKKKHQPTHREQYTASPIALSRDIP